YWVRARALETPTQYENASTIGYENQAWNYHIYEGKLVTGIYPSEVLPRGNYVTGTVNIPEGADWRVDNAHPWILAIPDAAIFGGAGQTVVHVHGTLNIWKTGMISTNKEFGSYSSPGTRPIIETVPYILVHPEGTLVRDPYAFLNAPVIIRGGIVRINTPAARIRLESGKLYLTYYQDGTAPGDPPSCDYFKTDTFSLVEWLGGKIYRMGIDCGSSLYLSGQSGGDAYIGPDDQFGVVASAGTQDCRIYYASRNAEDCSEFYGLPPGTLDPSWEEPPVVAGTSTATTTPSDTGTSTATSTPPITQDNGSSTSTATTTPSVPGEGSTSSTTTPPTTPPGDTASSTSTSTPPTTPPGDVLGTSTATTTPPVVAGETSTSTSTSTPSETGGGSATSTASSTPPVGDGGGTATSTPGVFCYDGPAYYEGITLEELNATCGHGWAPRPTIFPITMWGRNPLEERMQITEYYIGATGEASWFKVSNMMGFVPVDLGITDIFMDAVRTPFPVLSILARQYVLLRTPGALVNEPPTTSMNGGVEMTQQYAATVLPELNGSSGSIRFNYTSSLQEEGVDTEVLNFTRGECSGVVTSIGSCVLMRPYMVGNYPGDAGYVPWSMPTQDTATSFSAMLSIGDTSGNSTVSEELKSTPSLESESSIEAVMQTDKSTVGVEPSAVKGEENPQTVDGAQAITDSISDQAPVSSTPDLLLFISTIES
ncbi:MAG TPA: hypothetical protein VJ579_01295, partial [Candidatus Paceibacterota bacterium]|nr:hypothetical protein [Candidatus Paceibacterota bacterium]